jgi:hypothetical protein
MTIYAFEAQESWLQTVAGQICSAVEVEEATLHLHFGATQPDEDGMLAAERTISMHGVWRIERAEEIVAGSGDLESASAASRLAFITGTTLERFEVSQPGFDLDLFFNGRIVVRSFPCNSHEYAQDDEIEDDADITVSWWIDGAGVPDDWEEHYDPPGV